MTLRRFIPALTATFCLMAVLALGVLTENASAAPQSTTLNGNGWTDTVTKNATDDIGPYYEQFFTWKTPRVLDVTATIVSNCPSSNGYNYGPIFYLCESNGGQIINTGTLKPEYNYYTDDARGSETWRLAKGQWLGKATYFSYDSSDYGYTYSIWLTAKIPYRVKGVSVNWASTSSVKVAWKKFSGADGYQVQRKIGGGKYKLVKTTTARSCTCSVKAGKKNAFRVRAFDIINGEKVYSKWSVAKGYRA